MDMWSKIKLVSEYQGLVRKDNDWDCNHYKCTIRFENRQYTFDYYMGLRISGEPTLDSVMESLLMDCNVDQYSFDEFCGEFGYDTDSRKAEASYKACLKLAKNVKRVFGDNIDKLARIVEARNA